MLRISASLDLETVLREEIDGARDLTGAGYGAIVAIDDTKTLQDFVTFGLIENQHRWLEQRSDELPPLEHLRDLPGPIEIADLATFARPRRPRLMPPIAGSDALTRSADGGLPP